MPPTLIGHIPHKHHQHSAIRSSRPQHLVPPCPCKRTQHPRKQQRAHQQNRNTRRSSVAIQRTTLKVFDQGVQEVGWDDQEAGDGESDEQAGADVDARLRVIDFVRGARFEGVFLGGEMGCEVVGLDLGVVWAGQGGCLLGSRIFAERWLCQ